jgi:hypothetical protein
MLKAGMQAKKRLSSPPFPEGQFGQGLSRNDLFVLCLLFVPPLVFNPGGSKGKEEPIFIKYFLSLPRKSSAVSAYSAVDFFFILGGRRDL